MLTAKRIIFTGRNVRLAYCSPYEFTGWMFENGLTMVRQDFGHYLFYLDPEDCMETSIGDTHIYSYIRKSGDTELVTPTYIKGLYNKFIDGASIKKEIQEKFLSLLEELLVK